MCGGGSDERSHPKHTLEQGLARLRAAGPHRPRQEPPAASLPPAELLQTVCGGSSRAGMRRGKKRAGQREGWWGGKNTGIPGASPRTQPVCLSAWWGEERGEGKTGGRRSQKYTFQSKTQSLPCLQASPHRNATYVSSDPKVGNYSQAPELISAGSSATHHRHPPKKKKIKIKINK